jgi:hypothetical protein
MADRYLLLYDAEGVLIRETDTGEKTRTAGSWEAMSQLSGRTDAVQAPVTGLGRDETAVLMREVTGLGLDRYLDLEVGAYGSADLAALVTAARDLTTVKYGADLVVVAITNPAGVSEVVGAADVVVAVADDDAPRADGAKHVIAKLLDLVPLVLENRVA